MGPNRPPDAEVVVIRGMRVAVIGAGAFGGWTALELTRRHAAVTLIDAWGRGTRARAPAARPA